MRSDLGATIGSKKYHLAGSFLIATAIFFGCKSTSTNLKTFDSSGSKDSISSQEESPHQNGAINFSNEYKEANDGRLTFCTAAGRAVNMIQDRVLSEKVLEVRSLDAIGSRKIIVGSAGSGRLIVPQLFLQVLSADQLIKYLFSCSSGVYEGYTIQEHTIRVLDVLNDQRRYYKIPDDPSLDAYRLLIWMTSLHDIGKPAAVELGNKNLQHRFIGPTTKKLLTEVGFNMDQVSLAVGIVEHDDVGKYMKGDLPREAVIEGHKRRFADLSRKLKISLSDVWEMQHLFYVSDSTSYPIVRNNYFKGIDVKSNSKIDLPKLDEKDLQLPILPTGLKVISDSGKLEELRALRWN